MSAQHPLRSDSLSCRKGYHKACEKPRECFCECHDSDDPETDRSTGESAPKAPSSSVDDGFIWRDPTPRSRPRTLVTEGQRAAMLANRGRWMLVRTMPKVSSAGSAANSVKKSFGAGWEACGRRNDAGGSDLYVRFVGKS